MNYLKIFATMAILWLPLGGAAADDSCVEPCQLDEPTSKQKVVDSKGTPANPLFLSPGDFDSNGYGWVWGSRAHRSELVVEFKGSDQDIVMMVSGYDIDFGDEVDVLFNDNYWGRLSPGESNSLNQGDSFRFSFADQDVGKNRVRFIQNVPGWKWGVTNISLATLESRTDIQTVVETPEISDQKDEWWSAESDDPNHLSGKETEVKLELNQIDSNGYGWVWGSRSHREQVQVTFPQFSEDVQLEVSGYDIDFSDEVNVFLNDVFWGSLSKGANNELNDGDKFVFTTGDQTNELNRVTFVQNAPSWKWGVTNLFLSKTGSNTPAKTEQQLPSTTNLKNNAPSSFAGKGTAADPIALPLNQLDSNGYGWVWGSRAHREEVVFSFTGGDDELQLQVFGYDVDFADEVDIYLNGEKLGSLSQSPKDALNAGDIYAFPSNVQLKQDNIIRFVQKQPGWKWGVSNIKLISTEEVELMSVKTPTETESTATLNIESEQIENVELKIEPDVVVEPESVEKVMLASSLQALGKLKADVVISVGGKNAEKYGYYFGRKRFRDELRLAFEKTDGGLMFSADGYSIDNEDEIKLLINDVELGFMAAGSDGEKLTNTSVKIPADLLVPGYNLLVLKQKKPGWKWGVTNLSLKPLGNTN